MTRVHSLPLLLICGATACASPSAGPTADPAAQPAAEAIPLFDHHAHLFSPAVRHWLEQSLHIPPLDPFSAAELIPIMSVDRVDRAAILSNAYFFARLGQAGAEQAKAVAAENDWVAAEVARHPDRLIAFLGVNPLADSALAEIDRCAASRRFVGLKLHLANSHVDLRDPAHVHELRRVFERANQLGLVIVIHMRTQRDDYSRADAEIFIDQVLPGAPDVAIQIAHMAGWGGYDEATDAALGAFIDRLASDQLARDRLYFDVSAVVRGVKAGARPQTADGAWWPDKRYERLVERLRALGLEHVLFGTDWPDWTPRAYAADLAKSLPLDDRELRNLLDNRAPWLR